MKIEIRRLVAANYEGYIELSDQLDEYHRIALPQYFSKPQEQFRPLEEYLKLIDDPAFLINGAFTGGKLVGYAYSFLRETSAAGVKLARKFVMIDGIVVDKNCKRMGIGKKLFDPVNPLILDKIRNYAEICINSAELV